MSLQSQIVGLPRSPGVYLFRDARGQVLYIGKANSLRDRVKQYFGSHDARPMVPFLVSGISRVDHMLAESEIEALLLESQLIKRYRPKYNVREKDDKSYAMLEVRFWRKPKSKITADRLQITVGGEQRFPRISIIRYKEHRELLRDKKTRGARYFGPFSSSESLKQALRLLRKIFPFRDCSTAKFRRYQLFGRGCLYHSLGLCPAPCAEGINENAYRKEIRQLISFLQGRKASVLKEFRTMMDALSKQERFEEAGKIRDRLHLLETIGKYSISRREGLRRPIDKVESPGRIEAYDISNIQGDHAVGSMVVFVGGVPDKAEYRRFRIKTVLGANDVAMLSEVLRRRLLHSEWPLPEVIIVDGGKPQVNSVAKVLLESKLSVPLLGVAKGKLRKRADEHWHGERLPISERLLRNIRDEAHRFAISYYRKTHRKSMLKR